MLQLLGCWRGGEGWYCNLVETETEWGPGEGGGKTQRRLGGGSGRFAYTKSQCTSAG